MEIKHLIRNLGLEVFKTAKSESCFHKRTISWNKEANLKLQDKTARYSGIPLSRTRKGLEIERVQHEEKILNFR